MFATQGMGHGHCTLALRASQSFVYRELTGRVIIVIVIVMVTTPSPAWGTSGRFSGKVGHCTEEIEGQCLVDVLVFLPIAEQENPQC